MSWNGEGAVQYRDPKTGQYIFVEPSGEEGKWNIGYSKTAIYNDNDIMIKSDLDTDTIKKTLAGLANGSLEIGENGIRRATKTESSVTSTNEEKTQVSDKASGYTRRLINEENASIRDQIKEHLDEINKLDSVVKVNYTKITDKEVLRKRLMEEFSNLGGVIERQNFGKILFGKNEIREGTNYANKDAEYAAFFAVPKVLKRGKLISGHNDHKGQSFRTVTFAAPVEINGENYIVGVIVKETGKYRYKAHRILLTSGEEVRGDIKNSAEPTSVDMLSLKEDQGTTISSTPNNSIPQNSEKSTKNAEKVDKNFLADEKDGEEATSQDARKRSLLDDNAKGDGEGESEAERALEREFLGKEPENMTERERKRGYTDNEANTARALVKDFDVLSRERRIAIIEMIRSAEACKAKNSFMKHAASMIAYWRKGLYIIADDKTSEKGFYQTFDDGSRLIVVNPNSSVKNAINVAFVHELAHDIWAKATDKMKDTLYRMATESATAAEVEDIRKEYTDGYEKRGLEIDEDTLREEVFTGLIAKTLGKEDFLERFDYTPGRMTAFKRSLKAVTRMAKCFFGKNKSLYSRTEKMARALIRVMGAQLATETVAENRIRRYEIKRDKNGKEYWKIDSGKDIFNGLTTPDEYREAAFEYLISNRDNKVIVKDDLGREIVFIRLSAEEFTRSEESNNLFNDNPEQFKQKMRLIPSLDDILLHYSVTWSSPDHKNHKLFKEKGFENYRGRVRIDNVIFNTIVRVGKAKFGDVFYDINLEVDSYLPHTNSASDINESTSSNNSISENSEKSTPEAKKSFSLSGNNGEFDPEAFIDQAIKRGFGDNVDTDANIKTEKSQTSDNTKAELKEAKREARGLRRANEQLADTAIKAQEKNRELREENRQLKKEAQASEIRARNAEKNANSQKERFEKEKALEVKQLARTVKKLVNDFSFLVNETTHRKYTVGGSVGATVLSSPVPIYKNKGVSQTFGLTYTSIGAGDGNFEPVLR